MKDPRTIEVRPNHRFDEEKLKTYLKQNLPDFEGNAEIRQYAGGQSNPTFLIQTPSRQFVLRKKPPGKLLPSAHLVEREYRVMTALAASGVPVPPCRVLCEDPEVIGTPFFVMDHVPGRIFDDPTMPDLSPEQRSIVFDDIARVLAALHRVEPSEVGLGDFGRASGYVARQIQRWAKQYEASKTQDIPDMDNLIEWLQTEIPAEDRVAIAHGDYRPGNLIIHPTEPKVAAVLDWELSTLGHPHADLAYFCMAYHMPNRAGQLPGFLGEDLDRLGIPSEAQFVERYLGFSEQGRIVEAEHRFFVAFSLFRLAAIAQGVFRRGLDGNASDASAGLYGEAAKALASLGWSIAQP